MDQPEILFVSSSFSLDGRTYRGISQRLADGLRADGFRIYTASNRRDSLSRVFDMLRVIWRLRRTVDVVHIDTFGAKAFLWAELSATLLRRLNKPYILTLRGGSLPDVAKRLPRRMHRLLVGAAHITSPSAFMRDHFSHMQPDIEVIRNPLYLDRYPYRERREFAPRLIWLRAFHRIYDPLTPVRALAMLRQNVPDAIMTMIGPDKGDGTLQAVRQLIAELKLGEVIEIIEGIPNDEVGAYLNKHDLFINTSHIDNAPVTVTEALACGLCVISTPAGAIPEVLSNPTSGVIVPVDDPMTLADTIRKLLGDPERVHELSQHAGVAAQRYDSGPIFKRWGVIMREVAASQYSQ